MVHFVLLSGGSGTRLWPLSNESRSKQFLKVLRDDAGGHVSMVQRVFSQINRVEIDHDVTIATCESQRGSIAMQVQGDYVLVLEPERRDTAAAIMLACAHLGWEQKADARDTVVVMPIDTYADQAFYDSAAILDRIVESHAADLALLGVEPTYPSEKYGYIVPSSRKGDAWPVAAFQEKPTASEAERFIAHGGVWNCGVFAFQLKYALDLLANYTDASSFVELVKRYGELPKRSFDYEVVEHANDIAVVPYSGVWKDLGTWNTLSEEMAETTAGRVVMDESSCENVHVINETDMPMVIAGARDMVVVATPDGILVSGKEASAHIKDQVAQAAEPRPMYEHRRWGEYRVVDSGVSPDGRKSLVKELVIKPGEQLSYQLHRRRSEVWTIVSGTGEVVLNDFARPIVPGCIVDIMAGVKHACKATEELHVIEVQLGDVLVEEDIERFGFFWN